MTGLAMSDASLHPPRPHLRALTGVRFLAAFHVVLFHCAPWQTASARVVRNLAGTGYVAVSLFFVLSGFILSYTYCGKAGARPFTPRARREFYVGRVARIYPVYVVGLALTAPFFVAQHVRAGSFGRLALEAVAVVALVQSYVPRLAMAWNPPAWSLSTEASFYLAFPFLAPPLLRWARRSAVAVAIAGWGLCLGAAFGYLAVRPDGVAMPTCDTTAFWLDVLKYDPIARVPELVIGIVLGRLFLDDEVRRRFAPCASAVSLLAAAAVVCVLAVSDRIPYVVLHAGLLTPLFAALLFALASGAGPLAAVLSLRPVTLLGEASYSLYILHVPVFILTRKVAGALIGPAFTERAAFLPLYLTVVVTASIVCFRAVEVPMRVRVRARLLPRSPV
jgi:peptidoglycan/LPS O-acetylase OafA/YrhL